MTEEKITLVDAVNCKYPHQNLTEIYYNIGRATVGVQRKIPNRNQYHVVDVAHGCCWTS